MAEYTEYTKFEKQSTLGNPFTYVATGRFPIVGASVFPTYNDMIAFIESSTSTAYGGAILYVISDKETSKNGAYEIRFKDLTPDSNGALQYFINGVSNLEAIKLVNVNEQGGIESGNIIYGFYRGTTFIEERTEDGVKKYYNGTTEVTDVTDDEKNSVLPYIVLNLTNGDKIFINAEAFQAVSDTFVNAGSYDPNTKELTLTKNDNSTVVINLSEIVSEGDVAEDLTVTKYGVLTTDVMDTIKNYIDVYDCGTFNLTDSSEL